MNGDSGESSVRNGRFRKDAPVFDVLGDLDELNCWLGLVREDLPADGSRSGRPGTLDQSLFETLQRAIVSLSADLAGYAEVSDELRGLLPVLEAEIARLTPPADGPFHFRVPVGRAHVARAVCRRAERSLVAFNADHSAGLAFLNRLSSYLFALAEHIRSS